MSKRIKLTSSEIEGIVKSVREKLEAAVSTDGDITVSEKTKNTDERATICFKPMAWAKMCQIIHGFDTEIGWHGIVKRIGDYKYLIEDILVYPQLVTGVTVEMDEDTYDQWLVELSENEFNSLRMQGHSHVNMGVTPSGTDLDGNKKILSTLGDDMFYIFMIWNKKLERNIKIYDMKNNILFENEDIDIEFAEYDSNLFMEIAKNMVNKKHTCTTFGKSKKHSSKLECCEEILDDEEYKYDEDGMYYDSDWGMFFERKYTFV